MNKSQLLIQYKDLLLSSCQPDLASNFDEAALAHLAVPGPRGRLEPLVAETVRASVVERLVAPSKVGVALRVMETYARNVYLMPWKKEFHVITTYSAVYKNDLEPALFTLPRLFESLHYFFDASEFVWRWAEDSRKSTYLERGLDFRLGALECRVLENVIGALYPLAVSPSLVYEFRAATPGDDKSTALALRHRVIRAKQSVAKDVDDVSVARDAGRGGISGRTVKPGEKVKRIRFKDIETAPEVDSATNRNGVGDQHSLEYSGNMEYQNTNKFLDFGASRYIDEAEDREELVFLPPKLSQGRCGLEGRGFEMQRLEEQVVAVNLGEDEGPMLPTKKSDVQRSPNKTTGLFSSI